MKKIKILHNCMANGETYRAKSVVEVSEEVATVLIRLGRAEATEQKKKKKKKQ